MNIQHMPAALRERAAHHIAQWREALQREQLAAIALDEFETELWHVLACSDFVAHICARHPTLLNDLIESGDLNSRYDADAYPTRLASLAAITTEAQLMAVLRHVRRREMLRIAWRDLCGWATLDETLLDLSKLADACIQGALHELQRLMHPVFGLPYSVNGTPQSLIVLGMGKLGARELNFSSDVDLIFAYPEEGETRGGTRCISNAEYFVQWGQQLIRVLNQPTADGFVFRVDMRLRPFGESGPLAIDFDVLENYYQVHGREWERYALIKARPVAGDARSATQLMQLLKPFVYRRYLDFNAFESLREMKQLITQEVKRKGLHDNVKLGPGGIREVEFIGQALQLIRGGREPPLQERRIQAVLDRLRDANYLPDFAVRELQEAYVFLRNSEHRLQEFADQQTHTLPSDDVGRTRLAYAMGYMDWPAYEGALRKHMARVHGHFEQVFAAPQTTPTATTDGGLDAVWRGSVDDDTGRAILMARGYADADAALDALLQLRRSSTFRALGTQGTQRLDQLLPLLVAACAKNGAVTLQRVLRVVEAIARRTTYLALLAENSMALSQLVQLCAASPWITELLSKHPVLLDELLDPRTLYAPPDADALDHELRRRLDHIAHDDLEQQMEALRQFKQANVLRVAAADVAQALPLMVVSDHLSWIAETVLRHTLTLAWRDMAQKHGAPPGRAEFVIIAYGKLGGLELGYGSDLDIVFLHDCVDETALTVGAKPIASATFFARLAQRLIHLLTTHTPSGVLYDIDLRLRPSGASGMLVSSVGAFADYQETQAWTWEHQALVRARAVAGDAELARRFDTIRRGVLSRTRDMATLRTDVCGMREKMRTSLIEKKTPGFDLKQSPGGIVDIEFLVQFGVLAHAAHHPALLQYTDNIRLLEEFSKAKLLPAAETALLCDAYRRLRALQHRLALQGQAAVVSNNELTAERACVMIAWNAWLGHS